MATLTTEEGCPISDSIPKGIIENKNSLGGSPLISNEVPSFASLYEFIREFRKPIKTLNFWSSDKHAVVSSEQVQAPVLVAHEPSNEASPQLDATSSASIERQNIENTSQLERSTLQTNSDAQVDNSSPPKPPQEASSEQELNETPTVESNYEQASHEISPPESLFPKMKAHIQHPVNTGSSR